MPLALSTDQVLALAPDTSSVAAAKKLAKPGAWRNLGQSESALWGECQGSALYQTEVALSDLATKCSCPSRKFPCKHALGLLLIAAASPAAPAESAPSKHNASDGSAGSAPPAAVAAASSASQARPRNCHVDAFDGATQRVGAVTQMYVVNTGAACSIRNFGGTRANPSPAEAGSITLQPAHGTAEFVAPFARYTPAPGYVGTDEFEYVANAKGVTDQQVLLRVRVKVHVMGQ